jgi:hypothetical protein
VKHTRYVANLDELKAVLERKRDYTLVLELRARLVACSVFEERKERVDS